MKCQHDSLLRNHGQFYLTCSVNDWCFTGSLAYVQVIDFSQVTSMYGSVHCASQVVRRVPRRFVQDGASAANGH